MSNTFQIKRGEPTTLSLQDGELGFHTGKNQLFVGRKNDEPLAIGPTDLTEINESLDGINSNIDSIRDDVSGLNSTVDMNTNTIDSLYNQTQELSKSIPKTAADVRALPLVYNAESDTTRTILAGAAEDPNWYSLGASIVAYQNGNSGCPGWFTLNTGKVDGKQFSLRGQPNGELEWANNNIALLAYPVGSIYMSINNTSPASLFGGTWEQLKDRFLLGAGSTYSAGSTGGEAAHALTEAEGPRHFGHHNPYDEIAAQLGDAGEDTYYIDWRNDGAQYGTERPYVLRYGNELLLRNFSKGSGTAHNNMPPYLTVYMWKRIA